MNSSSNSFSFGYIVTFAIFIQFLFCFVIKTNAESISLWLICFWSTCWTNIIISFLFNLCHTFIIFMSHLFVNTQNKRDCKNSLLFMSYYFATKTTFVSDQKLVSNSTIISSASTGTTKYMAPLTFFPGESVASITSSPTHDCSIE